MDFRPVYQSLSELFPQVDSRILRAVAIEHSNDVHAAVEFIIYDVLPSIVVSSEAYHPVHNIHEVSDEVQLKELEVISQGVEAVQPELKACGTAISGDSAGSALPCTGKAKKTVTGVKAIIVVETDDQYCVTADSGDSAISTSPFCGKTEETIGNLDTDNHRSSLSIVVEHPYLGCYNSLPEDIERAVSEHEEEVLRCSVDCTGTVPAALDSTCNVSSCADEKCVGSVVCGLEVPMNANSALDESDDYHSRCLSDYNSELLACDNEMGSLGKRNLSSSLQSTQSGHLVNIDLLEDCVNDAKSNKKTLVSDVQSVVKMMKEAELLEQRAKQAREESSSAGKDILNKVEELRQMLQHAKQANDMHAGEVYGEKSILSTEARELQSRLLNLSDERNKSFSVIQEIRETLEARQAAAKEEIAAAEQEKLEKEELAQEALKEQEGIMDAIVRESKKLQEEAEQNAKLREFLMDRGRVVDTLQGELAVICEDVLLLKKRIEERVPLKGSMLMSTYSSASSSTSSFSHKSTTSAEQICEVAREIGEEKLNSQEEENVISSVEDANASGKQKSSPDDVGEERLSSQEEENVISSVEDANASGKQKSSPDDDWEFLRRHEVSSF